MKYKKIILGMLFFMVLVMCIDEYSAHNVETKVTLKFNEENILGSSKAEIIKEYGEFDRLFMKEYEIDGEIAKYGGMYKMAEHVERSGPNFDIYYWILFSEDDIAIATKIDISPDE